MLFTHLATVEFPGSFKELVAPWRRIQASVLFQSYVNSFNERSGMRMSVVGPLNFSGISFAHKSSEDFVLTHSLILSTLLFSE